MDKVVGVENRYRVVLARQAEKLGEDPFHGVAFAALLEVEALVHDRARGPGQFGRAVLAVVGDDEDVVQVAGVFQHLQVLDELDDDIFFVVGGDDDGERLLGGENLGFVAAPDAKESQSEIVEGKENDDKLHRNHYVIENLVHDWSPFPGVVRTFAGRQGPSGNCTKLILIMANNICQAIKKTTKWLTKPISGYQKASPG